ncbi:MAG: class I SAM-dependent methyltransferase [Pseudonocardiaceae bacterium]
MATTDSTTTTQEPTTDAFTERVFAALLGTQEIHAVYLGDRLGYYRALDASGPATSVELAARTGTAERYTREWLEHQAVCGYLTVDDVTAEPGERRFALPAAHAEVLTRELSLNNLAGMARTICALGKQLDALVEAFRTGGGVRWEQFGPDAREGQGAANRPLFLGPLTSEHLPALGDIDAALRAGGRVADVGCGVGWSAIGIASGYPQATVDGFDIDGPSIELARRNAAEAGVDDRVRFHHADAGTVDPQGGYALVCAFECIHDMPDPVSVLVAMRSLVAGDGTVLVMDERVAETFTAPGDEVERLMYGFSILCCLPDGLSHQPSVGTGTVMRPSTLEGYARQAGFTGIEVLPLDNDFFRFYRLRTAA